MGVSAPAVLAQTARQIVPPATRRVEIFEDWKSSLGDASAESPEFDDSAWPTVQVPHNWEDYQGYERKSHGNLHGTAWYRRRFTADAAGRARRFFIEFEGVGSYATVWLNGHRLGEHAGGRTGFTFDLTPHLLFGTSNVLAVRAHHPAMIDDLPYVCGGCWGSPNTEGSQPIGIFRPVRLVITDPVLIAPFGVHVWTPEISAERAVARAAVEAANYGSAPRSVVARCEIADAASRVITSATSPAMSLDPGASHVFDLAFPPVSRPRLWSPDDPHLHRVRATLMADGKPVDTLETPFGFRWIEWPAPEEAANEEGVIDPLKLAEKPASGNRYFSRSTGHPIDSKIQIQPVQVFVPACTAEAATVRVLTPVKNTGSAPASVKLSSHIQNFAGTKFIYSMDAEQEIAPGSTYRFEQTSPEIRFPELWTPARPYLHVVETAVTTSAGLDTAETSFGIAPGEGLANKANAYVPGTAGQGGAGAQFLLNGKPFFINGIGEYEHLLGNDHAFTGEQIRARVQQIRAAGFNALREAHHPHNLRYLELCDELGLLVWPQLAAHIYFDNDRFRANYRQGVREWVRERRNSPSIVLWGLQNESALPTAFARELCQSIRELDPTASAQRRIVTCNGGTGTDWNVPQNWLGTYGGNVNDYGSAAAAQRLVGEYGQWRTAGLHAEGDWPANWSRKQDSSRVVPEELFTFCLETRVRQAEEQRNRFCGHFLWLLSSHANPGRSEEDCRDGLGLNAVGVVNYKGLLTSWGQPVDAYYMYRANYAPADREPMVYICSHSWPDRFAGPGSKSNIVVFSNCDQVELFNDYRGASLGIRAKGARGTHFTWNNADIGYDTLYAEGRRGGRTVASDIAHLNHLPPAPNQQRWIESQPDDTAPARGAEYLYRVNCGGEDYADRHGNLWMADRDWQAGGWGSLSFEATRYASQDRISDPIAGTRDASLYQTFRYGRTKLRYQFPVADGSYRVELHFVEPWYSAGGASDCSGWRLFDVACNGRTVLRDLDIWKEAGHARALKKVVAARATGGSLTISFPRVKSYQAVISAIAIAREKE